MAVPEPYDDPSVVGSPAWWIRRLTRRMADRDAALLRFEAYYAGEHRLAFATEKYRQRFGNLFAAFADNWCDLVVDAVEERLNVEGFRLPASPTDTAEGTPVPDQADTAAWDIWQRNSLDLFSEVAHTESLINGEAYALVWSADAPGGRQPEQITIEHPRQMYAEPDPAMPLRNRAAVKQWVDDSGYRFLTLYLPEGIFKFQSDVKVASPDSDKPAGVRAQWVVREVADEAWPLDNPIRLDGRQVVPVVTLPNRPRLLKPGASELAKVIGTQDAVNKLFADLLIASEFQSFRQRYITGIELPRDPETNEPIQPYRQMLERVWLFEASQDAGGGPGRAPQVGELGQVDLSGYVAAIELAVQHIASRTRTPPHYFYLSGQFPSGESIKSAETGLVAKTRRKMRFYGEAWEYVIRLAFAVAGDKRADVTNAETIWADPESRSEVQVADAATKLLAIGVPEEALWEYVGFTPQQVQRFKALRAAEAATNSAHAGGSGEVPTVFDPVTGQEVEIRDPNLRHEAAPGGTQVPAAVGAAAAGGR